MAVEHHQPRLLGCLHEIVVVQRVGRERGSSARRPQVGEGVHAGHPAGEWRPAVEGGERLVAVLGGGVPETLSKRVGLDLQLGNLKASIGYETCTYVNSGIGIRTIHKH